MSRRTAEERAKEPGRASGYSEHNEKLNFRVIRIRSGEKRTYEWCGKRRNEISGWITMGLSISDRKKSSAGYGMKAR